MPFCETQDDILRVLEVFEEPVLGNIFIDKFETLTILFAGGPQQILALCLKYAGKGGGVTIYSATTKEKILNESHE